MSNEWQQQEYTILTLGSNDFLRMCSSISRLQVTSGAFCPFLCFASDLALGLSVQAFGLPTSFGSRGFGSLSLPGYHEQPRRFGCFLHLVAREYSGDAANIDHATGLQPSEVLPVDLHVPAVGKQLRKSSELKREISVPVMNLCGLLDRRFVFCLFQRSEREATHGCFDLHLPVSLLPCSSSCPSARCVKLKCHCVIIKAWAELGVSVLVTDACNPCFRLRWNLT